MNHLVKKSAVIKYGKLHEQGAEPDEVKQAIAADEKGFTKEEVEEIYAAIIAADTDAADTDDTKAPDKVEDKPKKAPEQKTPAKKSTGSIAKTPEEIIAEKKSKLPEGWVLCNEYSTFEEDGKVHKGKLKREHVKMPREPFERLKKRYEGAEGKTIILEEL